MSDAETRAAERGDDEAAALVAWRRTHDTRACPVCRWSGASLTRNLKPRLLPMDGRRPDGWPIGGQDPERPIHACGRCGVTYVEDAAGLSLECMEFEAGRGGTT